MPNMSKSKNKRRRAAGSQSATRAKKTPEAVVAAFREFEPDIQDLVRLFAVVYEPVDEATIKKLAGAVRWTDQRGNPLGDLLTGVLRERLLDQGILEAAEGKLICSRVLAELLALSCVHSGHFDDVARAAEHVIPLHPAERWDRGISAKVRRTRRLRNALYRADAPGVREALGIAATGSVFDLRFDQVEPLVAIVSKQTDRDWLRRLPTDLLLVALVPWGRLSTRGLSITGAPELMQSMLEPLVGEHPEAAAAMAEHYLMRARPSHALKLLDGHEDAACQRMRAWAWFMLGRVEQALEGFESALAAARKATRKRNLYTPSVPGVMHLSSLLYRGQPEDFKRLKQLDAIRRRAPVSDEQRLPLTLLGFMGLIRSGEIGPDEVHWLEQPANDGNPLGTLVQSLILHWLGEGLPSVWWHALADMRERAAKAGVLWLAHEAQALLDKLPQDQQTELSFSQPLDEPPEGDLLLLPDLLQPKPEWETALDALRALGSEPAQDSGAKAERRLAWLLTGDDLRANLEPREQKLSKNGKWTKGRKVALQRLAESPDDFPYLSDQDRAICRCIVEVRQPGWYGGYGGTDYEMDTDCAFEAAAGHPLILRDGEPHDLQLGRPKLVVDAHDDEQIQVSLEPMPVLADHRCLLQSEGPRKLRAYIFDDAHLKIAAILGEQGLRVPKSGEERLIEGLKTLAPLLPVHSDIDVGTSAEERPASSLPHMHLSTVEQGLHLDLYVHPFGEFGPQLRPGQGRASLMTEHEGRALRCQRDLTREAERARDLLAACPALQGEEDWRWWLDDPEQALEALHQLRDLGGRVQLDWPKGKPINLSSEAQLGSARVSVKSQKDWLAVNGELELDDGRVLAMDVLLQLVDQAQGRFLRLEDDQYLVLSQALKKRLQGLRHFTDKGRFHPLAAPLIAEMTDGMQVAKSPSWDKQLERLGELDELDPQPPGTLQAELRDYQIDGFRWLARLAHWGAGACLADDMGLGKTVQALALILTRAGDGPTLVIAPTSVCGNWLDEAARFAPTLKPQRFGPGDRAAMLQSAGPFDLIIVSYGLLQTEGARLAGVNWRTIVADEAQAFKNANTQRSKAIMKLQGDFRVITTGTPIENHLGELWNLFRFINPGLLGSQERFAERFANPIEQHRDQGARQRLRQLLKPFILRRLKSDVLTELPPRTEITLRLELSDEESALYEAMRRRAVERMEGDLEDMAAPAAGNARMQLLAEIMRLRRACCNPRLALPKDHKGSVPPSSKLAAFAEIVDELRENRHKALVFSQFVDHLALIREHLDQQGINYQYLDGSTPEAKRRKAIAEFQSGHGELFLISLRAGGAGLNLTAADYVIHMDPWWNPAVEDQASGRAHRIGQERPVTVYRLVAKGTIEESILDLHANKRDLADGLLEGTEDGGRLSFEDMLALVRTAS